LVGLHESAPERRYAKPFKRAFASKRRHYAKLLMGAGKASEARVQLKSSLTSPGGAVSLMKSLGLLLCTCLPAPFHPRWPASHRPLKPLAGGDQMNATRFNEC
jgi:hypothetical protein